MFKQERGITLVALVITIVVLLIISTVTIATLTNDDKSIITKAQDAKQYYENDDKATRLVLNQALEYLNVETD